LKGLFNILNQIETELMIWNNHLLSGETGAMKTFLQTQAAMIWVPNTGFFHEKNLQPKDGVTLAREVGAGNWAKAITTGCPLQPVANKSRNEEQS
jgi:hypothetical protein